jgi:hypothetical protein
VIKKPWCRFNHFRFRFDFLDFGRNPQFVRKSTRHVDRLLHVYEVRSRKIM